MANLSLTSNFAIWILLLISLLVVRCHLVQGSSVQRGTNEGSGNQETPTDFRHRELLEALRAVESGIETVFSDSVDKMATGLTSRLHELDKSVGLVLGELRGEGVNSLLSTKPLIQADAKLAIEPKGSEGNGNSICLEIPADFEFTLSNLDSLVNETEKALKMKEDFYGRVLEKISSLELMIHDSFNQLESYLNSEAQVSDSSYHCPEGWKSFGGSCYFFSLTYANWQEGRQKCLRMNGDYAKITTMEEWNFIANNIKGNSWIGLSDKEEEGTFKWVSDDSLYVDKDITWWHGHQPDNYDGKEDCVLYWFFYEKILWNDGDCNSRIGFICEMAPTGPSA